MVVKTKIYTNAISLGIATDASFQSFISRYSTPKLFISDNAKNFVGGLTDYTQSILANWCYNILEATSWWGGFWERMVHLVKQFPRKFLGKKKLNYEELLTFVMEVEGVINSSPLCSFVCYFLQTHLL